MIRLHVLAEGWTEKEYLESALVPHLGAFNVSADARCVEVSLTRPRFIGGRTESGRIRRGGLLDYRRARRDLLRWMKEDANLDAYFTTIFDLYALPDDFPG